MNLSNKFPLVSNSEIGQIRKLVRGEPDLIDLGYGEVNFPTPEHIRKAAEKALADGFTHYALPTEGIQELREAIAGKLKRENNIECDPDAELVVTVGGQLGINLVLQSALNPGDEVIISDPCFMSYPTAIAFAGGIARYVPVREERGFRIDPEDIRKAASKKTKMVILVYPDNPTGSCLAKEDLTKVAEIAEEYDLLVLCDEIYERYMWDRHKHVSMASLVDMKERLITLNGFSKSFAMTGWRIGYLVAGKPLVDNIKALHALYVLTITSFAQKGAVAALEGPQEPINNMVREYDERRKMMVEGLNALDGISCSQPWGSFYVYANVKDTGLSSFEFARRLATDAKVLLYPGTAFGKAGEGYVRISLSIEKRDIGEALNRMKNAIGNIAK